MLGNAELALARLSGDAETRAHLTEIVLGAQRAAELIRQIHAYSGKASLVRERVDLSCIVEEMGHLIESSISKRASLSFDFGNAAASVEGDPTQLRQVVMNLLANASDALEGRNGSILVRVGVAAQDAIGAAEGLPPGRCAFVEVSDTGVGMDADTRSRMFEPFFSTKFEGHGLGLAAVRGIVTSHGGGIGVRSAPGEGTSITVAFPLATDRVEPAAAPDRPREEAWTSGGVVLVVDDEPQVRKLIASALHAVGVDVLQAGDGRHGVDLFRERGAEIRAVVLDATPRMSGLEALQEMRRIRPHVQVVFISGYTEKDLLDPACGDGAVSFLQKPFRVVDLLDKVRAALAAAESGTDATR
jgi:CheY-like chemotaxis protein